MNDPDTEGVLLCFYAHVRARHEGMLLSEWLLEMARHQGFGGGSVFRAIAGFGRHGVLHEEAFFDLADNLPVKVEFLLGPGQAEAFLARVREAGVHVVYATSTIRFGVLGAQ
jgi:PII-like signaling protein